MSSPGNRILYIQYTNPGGYPPLEHSSHILGNAGWQVLFLGTGALGADAMTFAGHRQIQVRKMSLCPSGWRQKLHYMWFSLWALAWAVWWRPRWIYASDLLACPTAWLLSFLPYASVIYHEHDSPATTAGGLFQNLSLMTRRKLALRARMRILPNEKRAELFSRQVNGHDNEVDKSTFVVWNCPRLDEVSPARPPHDGGDIWVLYHGTIVPSRLPVSIIDALSSLPENVKLRVIGYETAGHTGYVSMLQERAAQLGVDGRVEFVGPMPRNALLKQCQKCDIGLAFMPSDSDDINMQAMVGASNKAFDYLSCGLALLVSDLPDWRVAYVETGYGFSCDPNTPESLTSALRWFAEHPSEMRAMGESGRQKIISDWNYDKEFAPIYKRMNGSSLN
jgi:glycosyltransferase involved in cell wall biosynthesis